MSTLPQPPTPMERREAAAAANRARVGGAVGEVLDLLRRVATVAVPGTEANKDIARAISSLEEATRPQALAERTRRMFGGDGEATAARPSLPAERGVDSWAMTGRGAGRLDGRGRPVVEYDYEAELRKVARMSPEDRARLQTEMVMAGALEGDFRYGGYDQATIDAYSDLLGFSEVHQLPIDRALREYGAARRWAGEQGMSWDEVGGGRGRAGSVEQVARRMRRKFVRPTYESPDIGMIGEAIEAEFQRQVGRPPSQRELEEWSRQYASAHRAEFEQQVAAEGREHEFGEDTAQWGDRVAASQARARDGGAAPTTADLIREQQAGPRDSWARHGGPGTTAPPASPGPGAQPTRPGEVTVGDPMGSFAAALQGYLRPEREGVEQVEDAAQAQAMVSSVFAGVGARMRGGS